MTTKTKNMLPRRPSVDRRIAERRQCETLRLALIDDRPLRQASYRNMLECCGMGYTLLCLTAPADLLDQPSSNLGDLRLVLLNLGARAVEGPLCHDLRELADTFPDAPLAVVSDRNDIGSIMMAFHCGVRGYLVTSLDPEVVMQALQLIQVGGLFVPANIVLETIEANRFEQSGAANCATALFGQGGFTPRELDVVELLLRGKSNKVIASELKMQESTVKVHVRHIMKKLRVTNRTQAALLISKMEQPAVQMEQQPVVQH